MGFGQSWLIVLKPELGDQTVQRLVRSEPVEAMGLRGRRGRFLVLFGHGDIFSCGIVSASIPAFRGRHEITSRCCLARLMDTEPSDGVLAKYSSSQSI